MIQSILVAFLETSVCLSIPLDLLYTQDREHLCFFRVMHPSFIMICFILYEVSPNLDYSILNPL